MTEIGDRRKQEILEAAAGCFAAKGFHRTSVDEICKAAGMSPGSLYRYFRGKGDIIRAMVEAERRESAALVESLAGQADLVAGLRAVVGAVLGSFADSGTNAMHAEITAEALRDPEVAAVVRASDAATVAALAEVIRGAQDRREVDRSPDPSATAELIVGLLDGLWWRQAMRPDADPARHVEPLSALFRRLFMPDSSG